jgi:RNase P subunit RPR2
MEITLNTFCIPYRPLEDKTKRDLEKTIRESNSLLERHHERMKSAQGISRHNRTSFLADIQKSYVPGKDLEIGGIIISSEDASSILKTKESEWDMLCAYSRLIEKLAFRWGENLYDGSLSREDLESEAVGAAIDALAHYTKEERFSTYLHHCVNRHLSKVFNKTNGMSDLPGRAIKLRREYKKLICKEGATFDSVVEEMELSAKEVGVLRASLCIARNATSLGDEGQDLCPTVNPENANLDPCILAIVEKVELSSFERAVLSGFLVSGGKTSVSKSLINPETQKPYSRMACSYAWKRVREKIEKVYGKAA